MNEKLRALAAGLASLCFAASAAAQDRSRVGASYAWDAMPISTARLSAEIWEKIRREDWSLVSCVVAPGFDYEDFELARRDDLLSGWPAARELILALT